MSFVGLPLLQKLLKPFVPPEVNTMISRLINKSLEKNIDKRILKILISRIPVVGIPLRILLNKPIDLVFDEIKKRRGILRGRKIGKKEREKILKEQLDLSPKPSKLPSFKELQIPNGIPKNGIPTKTMIPVDGIPIDVDKVSKDKERDSGMEGLRPKLGKIPIIGKPVRPKFSDKDLKRLEEILLKKLETPFEIITDPFTIIDRRTAFEAERVRLIQLNTLSDSNTPRAKDEVMRQMGPPDKLLEARIRSQQRDIQRNRAQLINNLPRFDLGGKSLFLRGTFNRGEV